MLYTYIYIYIQNINNKHPTKAIPTYQNINKTPKKKGGNPKHQKKTTPHKPIPKSPTNQTKHNTQIRKHRWHHRKATNKLTEHTTLNNKHNQNKHKSK